MFGVRNIFAACLIFASLSAVASHVIKLGNNPKFVVISQDERRFIEQDYVCVTHGQRAVACGYVVRSFDKGAIVEFSFVSEPVTINDLAQLFYNPGNAQMPEFRKPASHVIPEDLSRIETDAKAYRYALTLGLNYTYPMAHFQMLVQKNFAIGVLATYQTHDVYEVQTAATGLMLTINYYSLNSYEGFWLHGAGGLFRTSVNYYDRSGSYWSQIVLGTFGWRWFWNKNINSGIGVGAQMFNLKKNDILGFDYKFLNPIFTIDIGIAN
ncbi:MAG: hypothetical protein HY537_02930 [Deltaproteobacteria bacterium]|nr:hypothetical protein [Deltaproteobacteria bacterium]